MRSATLLRAIFCAGAILLAGCSQAHPDVRTGEPSPPRREMRGVFVTTAYNIDWPSKPNLHWRVQQDEIRAIVRRVKDLNCNVVFLQVRAFGDRIHRATTLPAPEPWSTALNWTHDPDELEKGFDPLGVWINECHAQGIELHAWVTPFRVNTLVELPQDDADHPTTLPVSATEDGEHLMLDPTSERVQARVLDVIRDLLAYRAPSTEMVDIKGGGAAVKAGGGINAIVIDHFPYPGPKTRPTPSDAQGDGDGEVEAGEGDAATLGSGRKPPSPRIRWLLKKAGPHVPDPNPPTVDDFIRRVFQEVDARGAKFGFSPMHRDNKAKEWLRKGWVHYIVSEIYFRRGPMDAFKKTLESWLDHVPTDRAFQPAVVAGLFTTRVQWPARREHPWHAKEIIAQIQDARDAVGPASHARAAGQAHYSWFALRASEHGGPPGPEHQIGERLKERGLYGEQALVPQCTVAPQPAPSRPMLTVRRGAAAWRSSDPDAEVFLWVVWQDCGDGWGSPRILPASETLLIGLPANVNRVAVAAVDRYNQMSPIAVSE